MKKISNVYRTSSVRLKKGSEYKGSYRKVASRPEQVNPVTEIDAASDRETDNNSLNMRLFYESIKEQREEYKHFYRDEQELEHDLRNIDFEDPYFVDKIKHLIHTYNHTILSLARFDKSFNTNFSEEVIHLLEKHSDRLLSLGIKLLVDGELYIYTSVFEEALTYDRKAFYFLIGHKTSLFYKLYQVLQRVKIPQLDQEPIEVKKYVGTIIDAKG